MTLCLKVIPPIFLLYVAQGDARRGMKQPQDAIPYWLRYLEINQDDSHVMVRIADAFHKLNDSEGAIDFYEQSLVIKPYDPFALLGLGNVYYAQHNDEKSAGMLLKNCWLKIPRIMLF